VVTARLPEFRLETYFSRWEFAVRHNLAASDAETLTIAELLALGTEDDRAAFAQLPLGYVETWGTDRLRADIAATYDVCTPDDVLAFAGAEEAIFWLVQLLSGPGDHVVLTLPGYQSTETVALAGGAEVTGVLLDPADGWRLDLDAVRAALRPSTRLVAVNFPNNPTGALPDRRIWRELVELCAERGIRLLSDEVHSGLELDPALRLPAAADLSATAVSINVMSKSYGLPGLRVGWVACRDHGVLAALERHKHYTTICNAGPSEFLASVALRAGERVRTRNRGIVAANLSTFGAFFAEHAELFEWVPPVGGCVAFPRYLGPEGPADLCRRLAERVGVLVLPAEVFASAVRTVPADRVRVGVGRRDPEPALALVADVLAGRR
jgi:aspartate/methionine/tyrosine aminotransferase